MTISMVLAAEPDQADKVVSPETLSVLTTPVTARGKSRTILLQQFASDFNGAAAMTAQANAAPLAFEKVFARLSEEFRAKAIRDLGHFISGASELLRQIGVTQETTLKKLDQGVQHHQADTNVDWSRVVMVLTQDLVALITCMKLMADYHTEMRRLVHKAMRFGYRVAGKITDAMTGEPANARIAQVLLDLRTESQSVLKAMAEGNLQRPPTM